MKNDGRQQKDKIKAEDQSPIKFQQEKALCEYMSLYREIDKVYHEIAVKSGLSDSAFVILCSILEIGEGCLQKDICDMNSISKQTVHSSIRRMEQEGYIIIKPEGKKDKKIYLTHFGREFAREKIFPVMEAENEIFVEMNEEEKQELVRLMKQYLRKLREKTRV